MEIEFKNKPKSVEIRDVSPGSVFMYCEGVFIRGSGMGGNIQATNLVTGIIETFGPGCMVNPAPNSRVIVEY